MANSLNIGAVGRRVADNIKRIRASHGVDQSDLARRLTQAGQPLRVSAISKAEQADRRVDVDDLVALAVALGTTPNRLLFPGEEHGDVALTPHLSVEWAAAWRWACGDDPLPLTAPSAHAESAARRRAFMAENRPHDPGSQAAPATARLLGALEAVEKAMRTAYLDFGLSPTDIQDVTTYALTARRYLVPSEPAEAEVRRG
jgi:transcriptional regulator with XRE-family HTH domain